MNGLNRRDIGYTIISRFEQMLRDYIAYKISTVFSKYIHAIPEHIIKTAVDRMHTTTFDQEISLDELLENTDFIHLKEIIIYKGNYEYFIDINNQDKDRFIWLMDNLYELRCKISHIRGYFTATDLENLVDYSCSISNNVKYESNDFTDFIVRLQSSPNEYIISTPAEFYKDEFSIPNNIPSADYEYEGGFIGRKDDMSKIVSMLESDLHRVITISGAGGVGKTALALKVITEITQKATITFDGIVWLSAKENKLTYLGIEDIEPTVKNYEDLLDTILSVMGYSPRDVDVSEKEKEVNELFELYNRILIVVDNLETISDDKIIDFIVDAHPKVKILITSRRGLGQVERRYELRELKEREAILLFRTIAKDKNLDSLATLDDEVLKIYVNKLSRYPLAIKWIIGHVKIGRDINTIIDTIHEQNSDISQFCFDKIYNEISDGSKSILCALSMIEEQPTAGFLKYIVNIDQYQFEDNVRELILLSLVIPQQSRTDDKSITTTYALLPLTRGYVRNKFNADIATRNVFNERIAAVKANTEEADRASRQFKTTLQYLGGNTEEERIAAMLAQSAFQKYQGGRYADSVEDYRRAIAIAPRFGAVYRNWAVMESTEQHHVEADQLMEKASKLSPNDPHVWLTWANMKRKTDKIKDALPMAQKALTLSPNDPIALNVLGNILCRLGEHEKANKTYESACLVEAVTLSDKHRIVNWSSMAENLKRWAEVDIKDGNYVQAKDKLIEAFKIIKKAYELNQHDDKTLATRQMIAKDLGLLLSRKLDNKEHALLSLNDAYKKYPKKFKGIRDSVICGIEMMRIYMSLNKYDKSREVMTEELIKNVNKLRSEPSLRDNFNMLRMSLEPDIPTVKGRIINVNNARNFVIIANEEDGHDTYIGSIYNFINSLDDLSDIANGTEVTFIPYETDDKKSAISIRF